MDVSVRVWMVVQQRDDDVLKSHAKSWKTVNNGSRNPNGLFTTLLSKIVGC